MIQHVFANRQNIGDWLSAAGIQSLLAPLPVRQHLCDAPYRAETLAELARLQPPDVVVIGGGGLFMDYFVPFWEGLLRMKPRVPYYIWGVGFCDSTQQPTRGPTGLLEAVVRGARRCLVRDELTRRYLAGCNLPPPVACPSLKLLTPVPRTTRRSLHVVNLHSVGPAAFTAMAACAQEFVAETSRSYDETNNQVLRDDCDELMRRLDQYRQADVVLSSGLHGCVLAVGLGRPVVAVSADRKVDAFMKLAGLADWVCPAGALARLPALLRAVNRQADTTAFVQATQMQHRAFAAQVSAEVK